jgi:hypothetical protein
VTDKKVAVQKTRLVPKVTEGGREPGRMKEAPVMTEQSPALTPQDSNPEPPSREEPIPEASNSDVVSVPGLPLSDTGTSGEQKTVILRFDDPPKQKIRARVPTGVALPQQPAEPPPAAPGGERTLIGLPTRQAPVAPEDPTGDNPAPVVANSGQLRVVVTAKGIAAEANLLVDGQARGRSPSTLTLGAGPHQIRIQLDGYRTVERWATVIPGTSTNLRVFLERE